jgi:hypothetical protein
MHATYIANYVIFALATLTIQGMDYTLWSSSKYNFLHYIYVSFLYPSVQTFSKNSVLETPFIIFHQTEKEFRICTRMKQCYHITHIFQISATEKLFTAFLQYLIPLRSVLVPINVVSRLWGDRDSIPGRDKIFFLFQRTEINSGGHPAPY